MRIACYHGKANPARFGQACKVLVQSVKGDHPRNCLVEFADGMKMVTRIGCLRWKCQHAKTLPDPV